MNNVGLICIPTIKESYAEPFGVGPKVTRYVNTNKFIGLPYGFKTAHKIVLGNNADA